LFFAFPAFVFGAVAVVFYLFSGIDTDICIGVFITTEPGAAAYAGQG
jgi:hypothetical protein